jgi:4-diphosphocytidyl-2-C-methyl-D-erythritol kinase
MYSIKANAKVNIYLKITGHQNGYHTLNSRFMRVENLYDTISFIPAKCSSFTLEGFNNLELKNNTIYKAFIALSNYSGNLELLEFFYNHKVVVDKQIPTMAGLGGGSSDAGAFLRLANEVCNLGVNVNELAKIGSMIGADVPFFVYNYPSANVSGFGEIIEAFEEEPLNIEFYFPKIGCDTALVYKSFRETLLKSIRPYKYLHWKNMKSADIIKEVNGDARKLNDLYNAALIVYPQLSSKSTDGWLFSGSGSSFFRIKN